MQRSAAWFTATAVVLALAAAACGGGDSRPPATPGSQATVPQETTTVTLTPQQTERPTQATPTPVSTTPQTAMPTGGGGGGGGPSPTVLPVDDEPAKPAPVPADWVTHVQPASRGNDRFTLRLPPGWVVDATDDPQLDNQSVVITSFKPGGSAGRFPPGSTKIDIIMHGREGQACGTGTESPTVVAGTSATQAKRIYPDNATGVTHGWVIGFQKGGYLYCIVAYFAGNPEPDLETFHQIINSMEF
jgi:hypothetical protein